MHHNFNAIKFEGCKAVGKSNITLKPILLTAIHMSFSRRGGKGYFDSLASKFGEKRRAFLPGYRSFRRNGCIILREELLNKLFS
jgi:hypothetical protein